MPDLNLFTSLLELHCQHQFSFQGTLCVPAHITSMP